MRNTFVTRVAPALGIAAIAAATTVTFATAEPPPTTTTTTAPTTTTEVPLFPLPTEFPLPTAIPLPTLLPQPTTTRPTTTATNPTTTNPTTTNATTTTLAQHTVRFEITGSGTVYSIDMDPGGRVGENTATPFSRSTTIGSDVSVLTVNAVTKTGAQGCRILLDGAVVAQSSVGNPFCTFAMP
jgi:hypothetical protein